MEDKTTEISNHSDMQDTKPKLLEHWQVIALFLMAYDLVAGFASYQHRFGCCIGFSLDFRLDCCNARRIHGKKGTG